MQVLPGVAAYVVTQQVKGTDEKKSGRAVVLGFVDAGRLRREPGVGSGMSAGHASRPVWTTMLLQLVRY